MAKRVMTGFFLVVRERGREPLRRKKQTVRYVHTRTKAAWFHDPRQFRKCPFKNANWRVINCRSPRVRASRMAPSMTVTT